MGLRTLHSRAGIRGGPGGQGVVRLDDTPGFELPSEIGVHRAILREQDHPGGVAVQPLMDAELDLGAAGARGASTGKETAQQTDEVGPPRIHGLVGGNAGRLADRDQPLVFEEDVAILQLGGRSRRSAKTPGAQGRLDPPAGSDRDRGPPQAERPPSSPHRP